jgi:hypothetical protein
MDHADFAIFQRFKPFFAVIPDPAFSLERSGSYFCIENFAILCKIHSGQKKYTSPANLKRAATGGG